MRLLKIFFATALILDAALIMTTTAEITNSPAQALGFSADSSNNSVFVESARK